MSDDDTILTTAELRAALAAALDDLEWRRTNEHAAARMIGETIAELLAQYEFAVSGLRAAREKIAELEADAAALREWTIKYRNARDLMLRDPEQFSDQECLQIIREKQQADQKIAELLQTQHPGAALLKELEQARRERDLYLVNEPILTELAVLRELRDDVQRWRDGGGDVRDLGYVLETLKKVSNPMTDEQKIAFVDALCAHFVATLDRHYTDPTPTDPRYDSGAAHQGETQVREMSIEDGWLLLGLLINGWADQQDFIIELPIITREDAA